LAPAVVAELPLYDLPSQFSPPDCEFYLSTYRQLIIQSEFMKSRISATEAARSFSELMNRVRYRGESFVVERGSKPICEILPARPPKFSGAELASLLRSLPTPDEEHLTIVEELIARQPTVAESGWQR
jgi:antitoxin (DNA-binding transcriptional repressor) of toxin-antitoxin stability system